jgi:uncharacterized protein (TIGR02217 family)
VWDTLLKSSVSGRSYANSRWSYPKWRYRLTFDVLRARASLPEMQELAGFFNLHLGRGDTFRYLDPNDNAVVAQQFAVGNGTQTAFQLVRTFGGYIEPVLEVLNSSIAVYKNGVNDGLYSINSATGVVTFNSAPANGVLLTWTGTFYWRSRFVNDSLDFNEFMKQFWELRTLEFITEKA